MQFIAKTSGPDEFVQIAVDMAKKTIRLLRSPICCRAPKTDVRATGQLGLSLSVDSVRFDAVAPAHFTVCKRRNDRYWLASGLAVAVSATG